MNKFKKETFINQRRGTNGLWTFQVRIKKENIVKSFSEKDYGSPRIAYDSAIIYRNKILYEIANKTILKTSNLTVNDVFNDYIKSTTDSYNTKIRHQRTYNKYINNKNKLIQELTKADIISDLNAISDICSDDTIGRVYSLYKVDIIQHALNNEFINRDLMAGIKKPLSKLMSNKKPTVTDRETILEVERLLLASRVKRYNKKLIVYLIELLYYTGMRPAEAEALTRDDIKNDYIIINKQLGSNKDNQWVITKCKTKSSERIIPINPHLKPILDELLDYTENYEIFLKDDGKYLNSSFVGNILRRVLKNTGINFNLYMLRHNMATSLVVNGTDAKTTMELLGHTQYNMSLEYANSSKKLKDKAIKLIN